MSLILDALNRSRREADPVPGLDTQHAVETSPGHPLRRAVPWIALAAALAIILWLLLERRESPGDEAVAVDELSRNVSSALHSVKDELEARATARRPQDPPAAAQPGAGQEPRAAAPGTAASPAASATELPAVEPSTAAVSAPDPAAGAPDASQQDPMSDEVAALYREAEEDAAARASAPQPDAEAAARPAGAAREAAGTSAAAESDEEPVDIERILQRARDELENEALVDHPAPFLADLSQQTKDEIPTILYQRHDYAGDTARSSVVMNGKTLRVGGSPATGVRLDEILPDSAVLTFRDTQFRLRALNSWVNL